MLDVSKAAIRTAPARLSARAKEGFSKPLGRRFYVGVSDDPDRRVEQHNDGRFRTWTRRYTPWTLVHRELYGSYREAANGNWISRQKGGIGIFSKTELDPSDFEGS